MINVGEVYQDKTTNKHYEVLNFFAGQIKISDGRNQYYISEEHFNLIFESPDYKKMYEQQKQRADELEKRWSELVDVLNKKYEYYKVRADDESAGPIEQGKWKIAKHELMMVLKIMTDLKRGETE